MAVRESTTFAEVAEDGTESALDEELAALAGPAEVMCQMTAWAAHW